MLRISSSGNKKRRKLFTLSEIWNAPDFLEKSIDSGLSFMIYKGMQKNYDVIVVGSGFAGSVFAREMADYGKKVLIMEKRPHVGGNMYEETRKNGIRTHKYGPHIFHTHNEAAADYVKRFADWYPYEHHVLGKIDEKFVPIPFNFTSIDMLFVEQEASELKIILINRFGENSRVSVFDLLKADNPKIKQLGEFIFEKVFLHYTAKQWGVPVERVDASTINRVPIVIGYDNRYFQDSIQLMPNDGYTVLFTNMLNHANITIECNIDAKKN
jgi:UDP-galactopyranose mutase